MRNQFALTPEVTFLNHGSFGACPKVVIEAQREFQTELECEPVQFMRELEPRLDAVRITLGEFLGCAAQDLALLTNATQGVNTVLRSLKFAPGDELVVTDHEYNACRNALDFVAERDSARVVVVEIPFPPSDPGMISEKTISAFTSRTKLLLIDHVTSPTGLIFPVAEIIAETNRRGILSLVDGAHTPGLLGLQLDALNASFYTGNIHKWCFAPKGAAFLHVRQDLQTLIRPLSISHGANSPRKDRSKFELEFGFTGTFDPSSFLTIPKALEWGRGYQGGWDGLRARNHALCLEAFPKIAECLDTKSTKSVPKQMLTSMASFSVSQEFGSAQPRSTKFMDRLQERLFEEFNIEIPVFPWGQGHRTLRYSVQCYNEPDDYQMLADALQTIRENH